MSDHKTCTCGKTATGYLLAPSGDMLGVRDDDPSSGYPGTLRRPWCGSDDCAKIGAEGMTWARVEGHKSETQRWVDRVIWQREVKP